MNRTNRKKDISWNLGCSDAQTDRRTDIPTHRHVRTDKPTNTQILAFGRTDKQAWNSFQSKSASAIPLIAFISIMSSVMHVISIMAIKLCTYNFLRYWTFFCKLKKEIFSLSFLSIFKSFFCQFYQFSVIFNKFLSIFGEFLIEFLSFLERCLSFFMHFIRH